MDTFDLPTFLTQLSTTKVKVEFIKKDGTLRIMICTKNPLIIPESNMPIGTKTVKENPDIIRVFDLEKSAWRSINKNTIRNWELASD